MDGAVVSREELYFADSEAPDQSLDRVPYFGIEFEEVDVEAPKPAENIDSTVLEFQLFGGEGPVAIDLEAKPEGVEQKRPDSFYFYQPSVTDKERVRQSAVSGDAVLAEAEFWSTVFRNRGFIAPDINANYKPPKRKCRPGKAARASKREVHQRVEERRKAEALQWQQMRRVRRQQGINTKFDKPKSDKPKLDRSKFDKPKFDKPRGRSSRPGQNKAQVFTLK